MFLNQKELMSLLRLNCFNDSIIFLDEINVAFINRTIQIINRVNTTLRPPLQKAMLFALHMLCDLGAFLSDCFFLHVSHFKHLLF